MHCARCGRVVNDSTSTWSPSVVGELCSRCHTGLDHDAVLMPEPDWWFARWLKGSRVGRWLGFSWPDSPEDTAL